MAIIVFDASDRISFDNISKWIEIIGEDISHEGLIFIVANKVDDKEKYCICIIRRKVAKEEAEKFTKEIQFINAKYFEVSAKLGLGIEEMFKAAASMLLDKFTTNTIDKDLINVFKIYMIREVPLKIEICQALFYHQEKIKVKVAAKICSFMHSCFY